MSWSWYIYSTLDPRTVIEVDAEYQEALAEFFEEHGDVDDPYAEAGAGGSPPPSVADYVASMQRYGQVAAAPICERLAQCRATVSFDYIRGEMYDSPLQVSILRLWLERLAPAIMDWGDHSLELGEDTLAKLARDKSRGRLGSRPVAPTPRRAVKRREPRAGEVRALAILGAIQRAQSDPDVALELRRRFASLSEGATEYLCLLMEEGVVTDRVAARKLGKDSAGLSALIVEIEGVIASL